MTRNQPNHRAFWITSLALTILNGCRVNHGHQDQAKGIDKKVAFSPLHLISSIKAAFSGLVSHFNALSVEDGRARGFFLALFLRAFSRTASLMRCQTPASANWQSNNRPSAIQESHAASISRGNPSL
jgi:hypothetical protein